MGLFGVVVVVRADVIAGVVADDLEAGGLREFKAGDTFGEVLEGGGGEEGGEADGFGGFGGGRAGIVEHGRVVTEGLGEGL
jgi:hypothetical protein